MKKQLLLSRSKSLLGDQGFVSRFKRASSDFTRSRVLDFQAIAVLLMTQGNKSLQLRLNEFIPKLGRSKTSVSKIAYSKARRKLKHTAFIELNQEAVVKTMYEDGDYQTWHGHFALKKILDTESIRICCLGYCFYISLVGRKSTSL